MIDSKIDKLERELISLKNEDRSIEDINGNFPLHDKQKEIINKKKKIRKLNAKYLSGFIYWLDKYSINLFLCSSREQSFLIKAFHKCENGIKLNQTERNVRKECMNRSHQVDYKL